jgi:hypothetical protein
MTETKGVQIELVDEFMRMSYQNCIILRLRKQIE